MPVGVGDGVAEEAKEAVVVVGEVVVDDGAVVAKSDSNESSLMTPS